LHAVKGARRCDDVTKLHITAWASGNC
jgi:hypothetical protein